MSLKDVLVFLDVDAASEERMRLAIRVARHHGACLSAVFVHNEQAAKLPIGLGANLPGFVNEFMPGGASIPRNEGFGEGIEQYCRERFRSYGDHGDWHDVDRTDSAKLIEFARAADLIVVGQVNSRARSVPSWRPDGILIDCGRPVLMVPYVGTFAEVGRRVLIAWDGSREASRALNDALPVFDAAAEVTVMTVHSREKNIEQDHNTMEGIVRHLSRHGIRARTDRTPRYGNAISDILLSRASDFSIDLIVAGAYHHSPLRETLVGGVSRDLLQRMTVPVLMSH